MVDVIFGDAPFYALAMHGGVNPKPATGGGLSVRGVSARRLHGTEKVLANMELRSKLLPFSAGDQRFNLGFLAFADGARVWNAYEDADDAWGDSTLGVTLGTGGGMRLQWGETFILRADVGWSPRDDDLGVYIDIDHIF